MEGKGLLQDGPASGCDGPASRQKGLSSKVNLLHEIKFRALCAANLFTHHPGIRQERPASRQDGAGYGRAACLGKIAACFS